MCPSSHSCEEIEASLVVEMEENGSRFTGGVRGFRIRVGGGERKEGERDGFWQEAA